MVHNACNFCCFTGVISFVFSDPRLIVLGTTWVVHLLSFCTHIPRSFVMLWHIYPAHFTAPFSSQQE